MNQELIDMAEKAGVAFSSDEYPDIWSTYMHVGKEEIEAFAALIAAAEREKFCAVLRQLHDSYLLASRSNNIRAKGETK